MKETKLIETIKESLKTDASLDLLRVEKGEIEGLTACMRDRVDNLVHKAGEKGLRS